MPQSKKSVKMDDTTPREQKSFLNWFQSKIKRFSKIFIPDVEISQTAFTSKKIDEPVVVYRLDIQQSEVQPKEIKNQIEYVSLVDQQKDENRLKNKNGASTELKNMYKDDILDPDTPPSFSSSNLELAGLKFPNILDTQSNFITSSSNNTLDKTKVKKDRREFDADTVTIQNNTNSESDSLKSNIFEQTSLSLKSNPMRSSKPQQRLSKIKSSENSSREEQLSNFTQKKFKNSQSVSATFYSNKMNQSDLSENTSLKKNKVETRAAAQNYRFMDVIASPKQSAVSITYEEIGLFPRSFNRVFDRFFKQLFFDVENLVIQEYRFYRYLFLTTVKCVFILVFVPFLVNFVCKNYLVKPITEYYWNSAQSQIFLNSYQQKRAFNELKDFEEKIYFESLIVPTSSYFASDIQRVSDTSFVLDDNVRLVSAEPKSEQYSQYPKLTVGIQRPRNVDLMRKNFTEISQNRIEEQNENIILLDEHLNKRYIAKQQASSESIEKRFSNDLVNAFLISNDSCETSSIATKSNVFASRNVFGNEPFPVAFLASLDSSKVTDYSINLDVNSDLKRQTGENRFIHNNSFERFNSSLDQSIQKRLQQKTLELAIHYNEESIESLTNFFADLLSFTTLCFLLVNLEIQINITKSFLLEVFFGLDDSKKSLLILFVTDLLVGYHSPNIWELFFQSLFDHYGLPESQTTIFLLVATLPVLLDVLFKYLIFRHLNRASPATVATYHAMIE